MNHLIDLTDLSKSEWENVVDLAIDIEKSPQNYYKACAGKILCTLFYEPSTRTQMSFQSAMLRLGGNIIGFDNPQSSSVAKGENLSDTIRIVSGYADVIAMRHPCEGAALAAALTTDTVLINAGDGSHLHPTQTLMDLMTIKKEVGHFDNLTIGLCGDLKNGRTVHSLINLLCHYNNIKFVLISTKDLCLPTKYKTIIDQSNCTFTENSSLENAIPELDVLYMTRIQKERFSDEVSYAQQKGIYQLDCAKLINAKKELKVLHPLPRVDEILPEVDCDPRACYFKQARYGVFARMALIITLLNNEKEYSYLSHPQVQSESSVEDGRCKNPNCISNNEPYLKNSFINVGKRRYCEYCDRNND